MASKKGLNNTNLKQENRGLILKEIATGECSTRIDLAKKTGLSKMSVSNIISEFMERGIICEQETEKTEGQGRNPISLCITARAPKIIGLNIHRTECVAVLSNLQLQVQRIARTPLTDDNSGDFYPLIFRLMDEVMVEEEWSNILGIGVGSSGPLDIKRGIILNPPDFHGLHDLEIITALWEHYHRPVYMDSQYNCAALAEKYYGMGKSFHDLLFVGIARGIGSGIISDDKIFHSVNGFTSELGHVSVAWNGNHCSCGNRGCLETYAGSEVIRKRLVQVTGEDKSFREFCEEAARAVDQKSGTERALQIQEIYSDMMEKLACAITSAVNMLNAEAVIIGHAGCNIPDYYLRRLEELINAQKLSANYRHVRVCKPYFREEAHILGCACAVLSKIFEGKEDFYLS
ncbi:MAG: ROK family transcriptional regulator [Lachnospiraceae bacterium]|nr:ROK family transcriptional regulator [Lachnospiraceae bacterium]